MKIVLYTAGLGNQIFQYFFSLWLEKKYPREKVYGVYDPAILANHNGLEVDRVFDITLPPTNKFVYVIERLLRAWYKRTKNECFSSHDDWHKNTLYYEGYWHDKNLFCDFASQLKFREPVLSEDNGRVLEQIHNTNSVFIHVRRGDYLKPEFRDAFSHSCPVSYYENAIQMVANKMTDVHYFVFSDDIDWVRQSINIPNATFVDWNRGADSFMDMYLMSHCKGAIIANSSFSFWGAMLGEKKSLVIKPKRWIGDEIPPIFPEEWVSL